MCVCVDFVIVAVSARDDYSRPVRSVNKSAFPLLPQVLFIFFNRIKSDTELDITDVFQRGHYQDVRVY